MVGVGQGLPPGLGCGLPGPVPARDDLGQDAGRARRPRVVLAGQIGAVDLGGLLVVAGELGGRAGSQG